MLSRDFARPALLSIGAVLCVLVCAVAIWPINGAEGATLPAIGQRFIHDTFTINDPDAVPISQWAPDQANMPAGAYVETGSYNAGPRTYVHPWYNKSCWLVTNAGGGISLESTATYLKPPVARIRADLSLGNLAGTDLEHARGVGLGFYNFTNDPGLQEAGWGFTGLVLAPDGDLYAYRNPAAYWEQHQLSAGIPFVGQFDPNAFYTLFYDVDFGDGTISNISLSGSTADYSQLATDTSGWFDDDATKMAAFIGSSNAWGSVGYVDNFSVMFIPEPGSWMLLLSAASLGLLWRRRK